MCRYKSLGKKADLLLLEVSGTSADRSSTVRVAEKFVRAQGPTIIHEQEVRCWTWNCAADWSHDANHNLPRVMRRVGVGWLGSYGARKIVVV
jgi:hypothetical protein